MSTTTASTSYRVDGMTCAHCASSVTTELLALDGVEAVDVDLSAGAVTVTGPSAADQVSIAAGVVEAGYTLVGRL